MTTAMQKWEIAAPGDANLRMVTAAKPSPKPDEILIEVDAVSLNYRERWIIDGGMGNFLGAAVDARLRCRGPRRRRGRPCHALCSR